MSIRCILLASVSIWMAQTAAAQTTGSALQSQPAGNEEPGGLEEIIVTAQKRDQNLQDVPVAVTAVTGNQLDAKGVTQFSNLTAISPSLTISEGPNVAASAIVLRGIGTNVFSVGIEPSVAVVVDDVALLQQSQAFSGLNDIARIEVLRGPQGTLFGKNASAGAVNIVTEAPTAQLSGRVRAIMTTDEEYRIEGGISGPISDSVGFRLSTFYGDREGYVRNLTNGTKLGADRSYGIQAKLRVELSPAIEATLAGTYTNSKGNGTPRTFRAAPPNATVFTVPITQDLAGITIGRDNIRVRQNIDPITLNEQAVVSGRLRFDLGPVDLISISSYQDWSFRVSDDVDFTALPLPGIPNGIRAFSPYNAKQFAQEVRLVSKTSGPQYLLGLYFSDGSTTRFFDRGPSGTQLARWDAKSGTRTIAAFAQATFDLSERTHIDGGLRVNNERIDVRFQNLLPRPAVLPAGNATCLDVCSGQSSDTAVTGKLSLRQDLAERVMAYVSFATGYKGQGYDISSGFTPSRAANPVLPEESNAYEIGLKSRFLDNRVQLNIAAFWIDYNNFQAQAAVTRPDGTFEFTINNVGKLRTRGVEFEVLTKPTDSLTFDFSAAYTDATVTKYPFANCYRGQTVEQGCFDIDGSGPSTLRAQDLAGRGLANSPDFKINASTTYSRSLGSSGYNVVATLDYRWQSPINFDLAQNPEFAERAYGLLNGSIGIRPEGAYGFQATLFVQNILNTRYAANVGSSAGSSLGLNGQVVARDAIRYAGLRIGYTF